MRLSTSLFASIVTICCTVGIVNSQILFADGSVQTTAFGGDFVIPSGDAYNYTVNNFGQNLTEIEITQGDVVLSKELVILKMYAHPNIELISRGVDVLDELLASSDLGTGVTSNGTPTLVEFPNGSVVVDGGRALRIRETSGGYLSNGSAQILGYFRDK